MITVFLDIELGHHPSGPPRSTHPNSNKNLVFLILVVNKNA